MKIIAPMLRVRGYIFLLVFFTWTFACCCLLGWVLLLQRKRLVWVITAYMRSVSLLERLIAGVTWEVRGETKLPPGPVLVAIKHQSAWETLKLHLLFHDPAIVWKQELARIPIWGYFMRKADMLMIDRAGGAAALRNLVDQAQGMVAQGRAVVIFPEGTRTRPGQATAYHGGIGLLQRRLGLPIVPVALNSGTFWSRGLFPLRRGTVVIEFLPPIMPGQPQALVMAQLSEKIEAASDRLSAEASGYRC